MKLNNCLNSQNSKTLLYHISTHSHVLILSVNVLFEKKKHSFADCMQLLHFVRLFIYFVCRFFCIGHIMSSFAQKLYRQYARPTSTWNVCSVQSQKPNETNFRTHITNCKTFVLKLSVTTTTTTNHHRLMLVFYEVLLINYARVEDSYFLQLLCARKHSAIAIIA